ncbi:MAG TPA: substrate-binding domain-containing protein [Stellaceae bacterium]|nr:substrate-binding domain-containing protein [Stellaceae bacterium]
MGLQNHLILRRPRRGRLEGHTDGWQHIATALLGGILLGGILLGGILLGGPAGAQTSDTVDRSELKVCADPNNLPYSDEKKEGFENKIAELMGGELGLKVDYAWFPQVIGFVRNTLRARLCDLVMGTVAGDEIMQTTNPYYFTTYVMFYRSDKALAIEGAQDARLTGLRLGVVAGTPPADLLVRHELMSHTKPYALTVDTRAESPTHQMVQDVIDGTIDVGFLWGPIAGYYRKHDNLPLTLVPLKDEPGAARMEYHIAMGVRANEREWRRRINAAILKRQRDMTAILRDYGVPLLNEQGELAGP